MPDKYDHRISFDEETETMEADFSDFYFPDSASVNYMYDALERCIRNSGEDKWFFLVNLSEMRIDSSAWMTYAKRGKALNKAHSQGSVRFDASEETRKQIERDANSERFDPNLFADRDSALARIAELPSQRRKKLNHVPSFTLDEIKQRVRFIADEELLDIDFTNLTFAHSTDVHMVYDYLEQVIMDSGRKWYFLVNYENCQIFPEAWVSYAHRGKKLNIGGSLGSVRYAPGSETEETIRMRAESQEFRPNIRNTRDEALERIAEIKRENAG